MPKIEKNTDKLDIVKPSSFKAELDSGDIVAVEMTGVHIDNTGMISIPATVTYNEEVINSNFPLNTGNLRKLKAVLGDDSDAYVGATFNAVVIPRNNPQTKQEVLSWTIKEKTIKPKA